MLAPASTYQRFTSALRALRSSEVRRGVPHPKQCIAVHPTLLSPDPIAQFVTVRAEALGVGRHARSAISGSAHSVPAARCRLASVHATHRVASWLQRQPLITVPLKEWRNFLLSVAANAALRP